MRAFLQCVSRRIDDEVQHFWSITTSMNEDYVSYHVELTKSYQSMLHNIMHLAEKGWADMSEVIGVVEPWVSGFKEVPPEKAKASAEALKRIFEVYALKPESMNKFLASNRPKLMKIIYPDDIPFKKSQTKEKATM